MGDRRPDAVELRGQHVRLEPLTEEHIPGLAEASAERRETYGFTTVPQGVDGVTAYVATAAANVDQVAFATVRAADGVVVGSTRFMTIQFWSPSSAYPESCEIGGTWLAASAQRTAINTEAKLLMLSFAFETWGCLRVQLKTDARNARSWAAIERIGATLEGVLRNYQPAQPGPGPRDSAMFSIIPQEWPRAKAALQQRLDRAAP